VVEHHLAMVGVAGSNPVFRFHQHAGVAELADARDLKSRGWFNRTGSTPILGIDDAPLAQLDRVSDYESEG
jgi:hypothetical protein